MQHTLLKVDTSLYYKPYKQIKIVQKKVTINDTPDVQEKTNLPKQFESYHIFLKQITQ